MGEDCVESANVFQTYTLAIVFDTGNNYELLVEGLHLVYVQNLDLELAKLPRQKGLLVVEGRDYSHVFGRKECTRVRTSLLLHEMFNDGTHNG